MVKTFSSALRKLGFELRPPSTILCTFFMTIAVLSVVDIMPDKIETMRKGRQTAALWGTGLLALATVTWVDGGQSRRWR
ncbi:hypothetical protein CPB84DRAFT_1795128 [Gymnopilus junonius]|uniref:Uncharacterized protein n=1 Tax=Gymnopilus junonius TaxID=109634 RepID=A0A9P5N9Z2_GYMJU|nr:hypothetical protein CPB84DRAFT_1795128 [Gymnopilus junonius]